MRYYTKIIKKVNKICGNDGICRGIGVIKPVMVKSMKYLRRKSCVGVKINMLTALGPDDSKHRGIKVKCQCGNEKVVNFSDWKRGRIKGCGCQINNSQCRENSRKKMLEMRKAGIVNKGGDYKSDEYSNFRYLYKMINNKDRREKKEVTVDLKYLKILWEECDGKCAYTEVSLYLPTNKDHSSKPDYLYASIDRIDSSKPYEEGNLQYVSRSCNYAKNTMSHEEMTTFLSIIKSGAADNCKSGP